MSNAQYTAVVTDVKALFNKLDRRCDATFCPQADWAGCVVRLVGHDFMDYDGLHGGADACLDLADAENNGLAKCLTEGEHGVSLNDVYGKHCSHVSLADFLVIAAEAVMTFTRQYVIDDDPSRASMDFRSQFKYGR